MNNFYFLVTPFISAKCQKKAIKGANFSKKNEKCYLIFHHVPNESEGHFYSHVSILCLIGTYFE